MLIAVVLGIALAVQTPLAAVENAVLDIELSESSVPPEVSAVAGTAPEKMARKPELPSVLMTAFAASEADALVNFGSVAN